MDRQKLARQKKDRNPKTKCKSQTETKDGQTKVRPTDRNTRDRKKDKWIDTKKKNKDKI